MKCCVALVILSLALSGCAELPFRQEKRVSIAGKQPAQILERFTANLPEKFSSFNSVVFDFAGLKFLGLGFIEISRSDKSFRVVCLNPMGVKLFDLSGDAAGTTTNYLIEPLAKYRQIGDAVAADIRRIYFDLLPESGIKPSVGEYRAIFGSGTRTGYLELIFAGAEADLIEKRLYNADRIISWQVTYHDFATREGKRYPRGIVLTNYQDAYQLMVLEKEQDLGKDQE